VSGKGERRSESEDALGKI
jgi:hypothetical protein